MKGTEEVGNWGTRFFGSLVLWFAVRGSRFFRHVAAYDDSKVAALLADPGIIRNRLKIAASIQNARAFLHAQREFGSFDAYVWRFVGGAPQQNAWHTLADLPAKTPASETMSKDLLKRGFRFVGPTICYAFTQADGMANDHVVDCFRHGEVHDLG